VDELLVKRIQEEYLLKEKLQNAIDNLLFMKNNGLLMELELGKTDHLISLLRLLILEKEKLIETLEWRMK
jgi:hypothetical protein